MAESQEGVLPSATKKVQDRAVGKGHNPLEGVLNKRVSRRAVLGGAAAVGGAAVIAAVVPGFLRRSNSSGEAIHESEDVKLFESVRAKINSASVSEKQRQETLLNLDTVERTETRVVKIYAAYESRKDSQGRPELLGFVEKRYGGLIDLIVQTPEARRAFLEDQIQFLRDYKKLQTLKTNLKAVVESPNPKLGFADLAVLMKQFLDEQEKEGGLVVFKESVPRQAELTFDRGDVPADYKAYPKDTRNFFLSPIQMEDEVKKAAGEVPIFGRNEFHFKKSGMTVFHDELPGPVNQFELSVDQDANVSMFLKTARHELAHSIAPENYKRLALVLSPEQLVDLFILREKAILDPVLGRSLPDVARMFSAERGAVVEPSDNLRPQQLAAKINRQADDILIGETVGNTGINSPLFDRYLDVEKFARLAKEVDAKYGDRTNAQHFAKNFADFLRIAKPYTDQLTKNPLWLEAMRLIETNKEAFDNNRGYEGLVSHYWAGLMEVNARAVLTEAFFEADRAVISLFTPQQTASTAKNLIAIVNRAYDEQFADGIAYSLLFRGQVQGEVKNSYLDYTDTFRKAVGSQARNSQ